MSENQLAEPFTVLNKVDWLIDCITYRFQLLPNSGGEKRKKDKSVNKPLIPTLIFFALSQSINNALATLFVFFIIQPALST